MAARGRQFAADSFTDEAVLGRTEDLYLDVCGKPGSVQERDQEDVAKALGDG